MNPIATITIQLR